MQENHLFEYAAIRVVPHVEREEFLNVGVILFCARQKFLQCSFELNEDRLKALCRKLDLEEIREYIRSFERICKGGTDGGSIGKLTMPERFRWLTSTRSTMLQTSKVHPGLCTDATEMLARLHSQMVSLEP
jgi:hypothetical protein